MRRKRQTVNRKRLNRKLKSKTRRQRRVKKTIGGTNNYKMVISKKFVANKQNPSLRFVCTLRVGDRPPGQVNPNIKLDIQSETKPVIGVNESNKHYEDSFNDQLFIPPIEITVTVTDEEPRKYNIQFPKEIGTVYKNKTIVITDTVNTYYMPANDFETAIRLNMIVPVSPN